MFDDSTTGELIYVQEDGHLHRKIRICHFDDSRNYFNPRKRKYNCEFGEGVDPTTSCNEQTACKYFPPNTPVRSLFNIVLDFIVKNFDYVDSLEGFPSSMGEIVFKHLLKKLKIKPYNDSLRYVFQIFIEAYGDVFLRCLRSRNALNEINQYMDIYIVILPHLVELDLSCCHLGHDHELINHLGNAPNIERLYLHDNYLSDASIRRFSLPSIMFQKGPIHLKELDLSCNKLTDSCLHHLKCFKELVYLNLSTTKINKATRLEATLGMKMDSSYQKQDIQTEGWAAPLMESILRSSVNVEEILNGKSKFYGLKKVKQLCCSPTKNSLVFIKVHTTEETIAAAPQPLKLSTCSSNEDQDLLDLYSSDMKQTETLPLCLWESK